jgi:hypothetical protein
VLASNCAPAGRSKVSPCQCRTGCSPRAARQELGAGLAQAQAAPADFLAPAGVDPGAQGLGDELGAQADAQGRPPRRQTLFQGGAFRVQEGVAVGFIDADGAAQHHGEVGFPQGGREIVDAGLQGGDRPAPLRQHFAENTRVLEGHVTDDRHMAGCSWIDHCLSPGLIKIRAAC